MEISLNVGQSIALRSRVSRKVDLVGFCKMVKTLKVYVSFWHYETACFPNSFGYFKFSVDRVPHRTGNTVGVKQQRSGLKCPPAQHAADPFS